MEVLALEAEVAEKVKVPNLHRSSHFANTTQPMVTMAVNAYNHVYSISREMPNPVGGVRNK